MNEVSHSRATALSQKTTAFLGGFTGTIVCFAILVSWAVSILFFDRVEAYGFFRKFLTVAFFALLFMTQWSQRKGMRSLQAKLDEILAGIQRAGPQLTEGSDCTPMPEEPLTKIASNGRFSPRV